MHSFDEDEQQAKNAANSNHNSKFQQEYKEKKKQKKFNSSINFIQKKKKLKNGKNRELCHK